MAQRIKSRRSYNIDKYSIIITVCFFLAASYVAFFHHNYWTFDVDGIYYLLAGQEILSGNEENVVMLHSPVGGSILFASLNLVFNDGFSVIKAISVLSATGMVFFSFYIIRNVFDTKTSLLGQLFFALNPWVFLFAIQARNEIFPVFLVMAATFFITKKEIRLYDVIMIGCLVGAATAIRYQSVFILVAFVIFLLIQNKKFRTNLLYAVILILLFTAVSSPVFLYNYFTHGTFLDEVDPSRYIADRSKFTNEEWKDDVFQQSQKGLASGILIDFDLWLKNYFYNLFYGIPNGLFGFENKVSASLIPAIPILGAIPVLGGLIYSLKIPASKKTLVTVMATAVITTAFVFLLGNFQDHFFAIIIMPLIVLGLQNIQKMDKKLFLLIISAVIFSVIMAHLPIHSYKHFLYLWIFLAPLCSIFFVSVIPRLFLKIQNTKLSSTEILENQKSSKIIMSVIISLILFANLGYSYVMLEVITTGNSVDIILEDFTSPFSEKINPNKHDLDNIVTILRNQPDIENSYVMANYIYFADIVGAKWVGVHFQEGPEGDSIDNYVTRENWKSWQIYFSNISSEPMDRYNLNHPIPDYLIYNPKSFHLESLKVLTDPTNSEIPQNFELLYKSPYSGITVYKIIHNEGNDV